jgi:hypothetical protein
MDLKQKLMLIVAMAQRLLQQEDLQKFEDPINMAYAILEAAEKELWPNGESNKSKLDKVMRELFIECLKEGKSLITMTCSRKSYGIGLGGNTQDMFSSIASLIKDVKEGRIDNPQKGILGDMILDSVTANYTPMEIADEMEGRIDKFI